MIRLKLNAAFILFISLMSIKCMTNYCMDKNYFSNFLQYVNEIKTKEQCNITFKTEDLDELQSGKNCLVNKMFDTKIMSLKCLYAFIVHIILNIFSMELTENREFRYVNNEYLDEHKILQIFEDCIGRMLSVLFIGKIVAPSWLWTILIKLQALKYKKITKKELFKDFSINDNYSFVSMCIKDEFVSLNNIIITQNNSPEKDKLLDKFIILIMEVDLIGNFDIYLKNLYRYEPEFKNMFNFLWKSSDVHQKITPYSDYFKGINWLSFNEMLDEAHQLAQNQWIINVFSVSKYITLLKDTVTITMLYCVLRHLLEYQKGRWSPEFLKQNSPEIKLKFDNFLENIVIPLKNTINILHLNGNEFYKRIMSHLTAKYKTDSYDRFKIIVEKVQCILKKLLIKYNHPVTNLEQSIKDNMITNIFQANKKCLMNNFHTLQNYYNRIESLMCLFNNDILKYFNSCMYEKWFH
ncbi:uncharacterized protein LOC126894637 [Daktulosphaira vitifoliae]|uniref:uncharacterized protein LOC126894637 n=1 Tax=Daktulosphaira vitifoliae TaxID=58002 RepID=UPI0021AAA9EE|nr:uncharacterized protein LOC126894637 [Daktulosphaira vitifoliae]